MIELSVVIPAFTKMPLDILREPMYYTPRHTTQYIGELVFCPIRGIIHIRPPRLCESPRIPRLSSVTTDNHNRGVLLWIKKLFIFMLCVSRMGRKLDMLGRVMIPKRDIMNIYRQAVCQENQGRITG